MNLDLSGLSPLCRDIIYRAIRKGIYEEYARMKEAIEEYSEGSAKDDMQGWIDAGRKVLDQIQEAKYETTNKH